MAALLHAFGALRLWPTVFLALWFSSTALLKALCGNAGGDAGGDCAATMVVLGLGAEQRLFADFFAGAAAYFTGERVALWRASHAAQRGALARLALACSAL